MFIQLKFKKYLEDLFLEKNLDLIKEKILMKNQIPPIKFMLEKKY